MLSHCVILLIHIVLVVVMHILIQELVPRASIHLLLMNHPNLFVVGQQIFKQNISFVLYSLNAEVLTLKMWWWQLIEMVLHAQSSEVILEHQRSVAVVEIECLSLLLLDYGVGLIHYLMMLLLHQVVIIQGLTLLSKLELKITVSSLSCVCSCYDIGIRHLRVWQQRFAPHILSQDWHHRDIIIHLIHLPWW